MGLVLAGLMAYLRTEETKNKPGEER
jgi:hypothetical protein